MTDDETINPTVDDVVEVPGRLVAHSAARQPRTVAVGSRVVKRRDAILVILDAAYRRDARGNERGIN